MIEYLETPCFIIDEEILRDNIKSLHNALESTWGNYIIGYSCKTNSLPWILNFIKKENCYAEIVSDTEYKLVRKLGFEGEKIIFNGPNKGLNVFREALNKNCILNIDLWREINWIKDLKFEKEVKIGIRVNINLAKYCSGETN